VVEPVEQQVLVHLVGDHHDLPLDSEVGDERHLLSGEHLAGRVVRCVQQHRLGARRDRRTKLLGIERIVRRPQGDRADDAAGHRDTRLIAVVHRLEHHHFVAGINQTEQSTGEGLGGAGGDKDFAVRVVRQPVEALLMAGHSVTQHLHSRPGWILVVSTADGGDRCVEHLSRSVGVRETLAEVDAGRLRGERTHLGEDRRAEALQLVGEEGLANVRHRSLLIAPDVPGRTTAAATHRV
jgi:hypothetical protein